MKNILKNIIKWWNNQPEVIKGGYFQASTRPARPRRYKGKWGTRMYK